MLSPKAQHRAFTSAACYYMSFPLYTLQNQEYTLWFRIIPHDICRWQWKTPTWPIAFTTKIERIYRLCSLFSRVFIGKHSFEKLTPLKFILFVRLFRILFRCAYFPLFFCCSNSFVIDFFMCLSGIVLRVEVSKFLLHPQRIQKKIIIHASKTEWDGTKWTQQKPKRRERKECYPIDDGSFGYCTYLASIYLSAKFFNCNRLCDEGMNIWNGVKFKAQNSN